MDDTIEENGWKSVFLAGEGRNDDGDDEQIERERIGVLGEAQGSLEAREDQFLKEEGPWDRISEGFQTDGWAQQSVGN